MRIPAELPLETIRSVAATVGRVAGLRLIVLFGSAAREGTAHPEDIDLGVLGTGPLDAIDLTNRFTRALGIQRVDVTDLRTADPLLLMLAARDGVPLYQADPSAFARFASLAARRYADTRKFRRLEKERLGDLLQRRGEGA